MVPGRLTTRSRRTKCGSRLRLLLAPLNSVVRTHQMAQCPHCHLDTIGYFAKHASWRGGPIKCRACGRLSYVSKHETWWGRFAGTFLLVTPVILVIARSWWAAVAAAVLFVALLLAHELALHRAPLFATSAQEAAYSRKWGYGFVAVVLVALVTLGWYKS